MNEFVFWKVTIGDIIAFLSLLITIYIAWVVQQTLTRNRYLREYFITELKILRDDYSLFFKDLYQGQFSARSIIDRLKVFSIRVTQLDKHLQSCFKLKPNHFSTQMFEIQSYITSCDEFNSNYRANNIHLKGRTWSEIYKKRSDIINEMTNLIIEINKAAIK